MKIKNKLLKIFILIYTIPIFCLAYSNKIIPGGGTIGIEVKSDGVLVVGFYKVGGKFIGRDAGFLTGDVISSVNDKRIYSINEMVNNIDGKDKKIKFGIVRDGKNINIELDKEYDDDNILKTGLYVKDEINGVGTLTYIDPASHIFGALGHEIIEGTTGEKFEIKDGKIFDATVSNIKKSRSGAAGEKNANYNKSSSSGTINSNEISGIYGKYSGDINNDNLVEVKNENDIHTGDASIRTVIEGQKVEEFKINILKLDQNNQSKNILFEIVDENLINKTGGVVQGMSGSPIMQDGKIIGAVNYVIVNDTTKGYGIFITRMLRQGDKSGE